MPVQWEMAMRDPEPDDAGWKMPDIKTSDLGSDSGDDGAGGSPDDMAEQTIDAIVECLNTRGPGGVARIRQYANALTGMVDAYMDRDEDTFTEAAGEAYRALRHLVSS
jgi:hypothetical protein